MAIRKLRRKQNLPREKAENKNNKIAIQISLILVMSFLLVLGGHFLFSRQGEATKSQDIPGSGTDQQALLPKDTAADIAKTTERAVQYTHRTETINGYKQEINLLEIDPGVPGIRIQPALSNDIIYGFELLSEMSSRKNAYAAVTGGFFSKYGLPSGMVVNDGKLISPATGKYPVFVLENGSASLEEFKSAVAVEYTKAGNMGAAIPTGSITAEYYNAPASVESVAVYTPYYGKTNRAKVPNITLTVVEGKVTKAAFYTDEADIPENGILITFFDMEKGNPDSLPIKTGDTVRILHSPELTTGTDAYECGAWLVRDGKSVVPVKDAWVGILTNRDPRTAIGIKKDGKAVLMTVDGRQPGYSAGLTGQELADYLIGCGITDAAMLDGGASAEMIFKGKLVSRPSYKGEERMLGGGILVLTGN